MQHQPDQRFMVAFVGQQEYFHSAYGNALNDLYAVRKYQLKWGAPWYYYKDLIEFDPHITFFFRPELYPEELLTRLSGVKVAISSEPIPYYIGNLLFTNQDMKTRFHSLLGAKNRYDYFFHFNGASTRYLNENGFHVDGAFAFPVDTGMYRPMQIEKKWDAIFVGRSTSHREKLLGPLKRDFRVLHIAHGIFDDDLARLINAARIGLNIHVEPYLTWEPRVQNMMACGIPVLSETLSPNAILEPNKDYISFKERYEFVEKFYYYLRNEGEASVIARNGLLKVCTALEARNTFSRLINSILSPETK